MANQIKEDNKTSTTYLSNKWNYLQWLDYYLQWILFNCLHLFFIRINTLVCRRGVFWSGRATLRNVFVEWRESKCCSFEQRWSGDESFLLFVWYSDKSCSLAMLIQLENCLFIRRDSLWVSRKCAGFVFVETGDRASLW